MKTHGHDIERFASHARSIVFETHDNGTPRRIDHFVDDQIVGRQYQDEDGQLESVIHIRDDQLHGPWYEFREGALSFITHYQEGLEHGVAVQYTPEGDVLGRYEMDHGTGVDLWYDFDTGQLAEEREMRDGERHGVERWWDAGDTIWKESRFREGIRHGVFREWNDGELDEDFPQFFVDGDKLDRDRYAEAAAEREDLPAYDAAEDSPSRERLESTREMLAEMDSDARA
jgi:antitoxin component YwqK of YwqJK toxin-antitoxin module